MVGRYRIHALLGVGGMGRVYLGSTPAGPGANRGGSAPATWAAVKVIRPDLADDPDFRRRFARELEAVGRVSTPYAAALVHGEPRAQQPWMATEFVPGVALGDAVRQGSALPDPAVWRLAADLGSALVAVHQADLVHRDVKPSNVILGTEGAKIIDFGVAHASDLSQLTATGLNVGTPSYMAPEQAKSGEVTPASDIFSLGVLLYFAATGKLPFGEGGTAEVLFRVVYEEPDFDSLARVSPALRELVLRCLGKDPLSRPNAAGVVAQTQAAATAGAWVPGRFAQWPAALAERIAERTRAAGRTLPELADLPEPPKPAEPAPAPHRPDFDPQALVIPVPPALPPDELQTVLVDNRPGGNRVGDALTRPGRARTRGRIVVGAAAVTVVVLGVAAMLVWGPGGGSGAGGDKVDALTGTSAVIPGGGASLGEASGTASAFPSGSISPSATVRPSGSPSSSGSAGPASSAASAASSAAGGGVVNGSSSSAAAPGGGAGGSTTTSAAAAPTSAKATTASPTASPVNTGCSGWDAVEQGSEYGYGSGNGSWNLYIGPYSACATTGFTAAHGDRLRLWCYVTNAYGNEWTYVQDTVNDKYGWISDSNFVGAVGASNRC
ncbi:serine/threonine protein kinase [Actinospica durhamensis]|uniref:Serine/threonine protein kinase n=1 Tax=Actinospica durhamensis TaxID=1508375 RepID=A0A941ISB4_9ACTN|nr:serine/threonine-protein kinase [Actinospica durhamensis]MBR7833066.1 serine/threonine protein kinase [Actinospica durhamensis]